MFSKINVEFDTIETAERAAKRIRETVNGPKKIRISQNRTQFESLVDDMESSFTGSGEVYVLLPAAINSYNYITGTITRPVNISQIKEPLLRRSVTMEVTFDESERKVVNQIVVSGGGYDIRPLKH